MCNCARFSFFDSGHCRHSNHLGARKVRCFDHVHNRGYHISASDELIIARKIPLPKGGGIFCGWRYESVHVFDIITPLCYLEYMNMIRTTISLREDVYDNLRRLAAVKRMSLSKVINHRLLGHAAISTEDAKRKAWKTKDFFASLSKKTPKIDPLEAIGQSRGDRDIQLSSK